VARRLRDNIISTESIATTLAATAKIGDFLITAEVTAALTATAVTNIEGRSDIASVSTMTVSATTVSNGQATLESNFAQNIEYTRIRFNSSIQSAEFNSTATVVKTARVIANFNTVTEQTSTATKVISSVTALSSNFVQTVNANRLRNVNAALTSVVYDFTCSPTFIVRVSANFIAFNTQLTAGRIIHLDPLLTWRIEPETRYLKINDESRVYMIEEETRIIKIKGYVL
jgi:hypothetical protein